MDFFSAVADPNTAAVQPIDHFAKAIADRFGDSPILAAAPSAMPLHPSESSPFDAVHVDALAAYVDDTSALIVDIRPHAAYSSARIPRAISLSVPSTLLKRPLFSLQRLSAMLPSASTRNRFSAWRSASRILVYDADSVSVGNSSNIAGLLRKFKSDGFQGDLVWLKGGFQAVWRDRREIVDTLPPTPDVEVEEEEEDHGKSSSSILRTRHLPMAAFSLSSTTVHNSPHFNPSPKRPPTVQPHFTSNPAAVHSHPAFNPFFDTIRQNTELSHGITDRIPLRLPRRVRRRIQELPFPWLQDIARRAANAPHLPKSLSDSSSSESEGDSDDSAKLADIEQGKEALAMQFFKIELSEQRRLMGIMEHHSKESGHFSEHSSQLEPVMPFPYSITAGVEKGAKNRYRHIWPFEHARVRLHQKKQPDDDYVNASYIQPLGTNRRYIATQGPLPATFTDFWTLCWEQNVHVIVMLTREVEGAVVKCGSYWTDTVFGPLRLRLVSTEGLSPSDERPSSASFFPQHSSLSAHSSRSQPRRFPHSAGSQRRYRHYHYHNKRSETVKRVFELTHTGYPEAKPRRIVHLQYLEWPDMNVPDDPRGVLGLIQQVEEAVKDTEADDQPSDSKKRKRGAGQISVNEIDEKTGIAKHALGSNSPVLLHCSAGVGRTGGFIAVDAILDAIRREIRSKNMGGSTSADDDAMDVDQQGQANTERGVHSITTVPLTMMSGVQHRKTVDSNQQDWSSSSGLVVHVPVATLMQVDQQTYTSRNDADATSTFASGTMQWAENVRDETGINGTANDRQRTIQDEIVSSNSPVYFSGPGSSSMSASSIETRRFNHGSYRYNSSSSVGTSVSGTSSSSKAKFPSSNPLRDSSMASELLQAVLNNQQNAVEHRLRTISAPSINMHSLAQSPARGRLPKLDNPARSSSSLADPPRLRLQSEGVKSEEDTMKTVKPSVLSFDFSNTSPFKLKSPHNLGAMSSDGELPSRSQSPSADEATSLSLPQLAHPMPVLYHIPPTEELSPEEPHKTFDYKEPRPLHEDFTPPPLTTFDDPIWEIVQDMREQRMSLCQSLRQYVFVHAAIIEGALMVVDEEREIAEGLRPRNVYAAKGPQPEQESPTTISSKSAELHSPSRRQGQALHPYEYETASIASSSSLSIGKRGASPTELRKEDKKGEVMLSKRPSIKRKQRSADDLLVDDVRYHPVPARVPSGGLHAGGVSAPSERAMPP